MDIEEIISVGFIRSPPPLPSPLKGEGRVEMRRRNRIAKLVLSWLADSGQIEDAFFPAIHSEEFIDFIVVESCYLAGSKP